MEGPEDPVEVVMRGFAAWRDGDLEAAMALVGEDVEWHHADSLPYGGVYHGNAALNEAVHLWMRAFAAVHFEPEEVHRSGDTVWAIGTMEATPRGGETLRTWFVHAYTVRGGRFRRVREWTDMGRLIEQQIAAARS